MIRAVRHPLLSVSFLLAVAACSGGATAPATGGGATPPATPSPSGLSGAPSSAAFNVSGSTNTKPFTFVIQPDGSFALTIAGQTSTGMLTAASTSQFYADIDANLPVSNIPIGNCAKSASFGTATSVAYDGSTSGDLSCPNSAPATQIWNDVEALEAQLPLSGVLSTGA